MELLKIRHADRPEQSTPAPDRGVVARTRWLLVAAAAAAFAWAAFVYQPWRAVPFDVLDFNEFLPLLLGEDTVIGRLSALVDYYASHGRFNVLGYAALVSKWSLFGWDTVGWQLSRFLLMCGNVVASFFLFRRLGASVLGGLAGASLFLVTHSAVQAWTRLTMGEPLGLAFLLAATLLATRYQRVARYRLTAAAIALLLLCAMLTKEMLVAAVPFVLLVACSLRVDGELAVPGVTRRNVWIVAFATLATLAAMIAVAMVALSSRTDSFASLYGTGHVTPIWFLVVFRRMLVQSPLRFPANLLLWIVVTAGLLVGLVRDSRRTHLLLLLGGAVSLPLLATLLYLPWPSYEDFYGLPFLLGPSLLLAYAVTAIERYAPRAVWAAGAACVGVIAFNSMSAIETSRHAMARREVYHQVTRWMLAHPRRDSFVVATHHRMSPRKRWMGAGLTLQRQAAATGGGAPVSAVREVDCQSAAQMARSPARREVLVSIADFCGSLLRPTVTARRYYDYLDWATLRLTTDSVRVDALAPMSVSPLGGRDVSMIRRPR